VIKCNHCKQYYVGELSGHLDQCKSPVKPVLPENPIPTEKCSLCPKRLAMPEMIVHMRHDHFVDY
jgi:hypothetical protein